MSGVLIVIGLFISLLLVAAKAEEEIDSSGNQWPRPWDKSPRRSKS